ncbi:MAG TPA: hypothetical protein VK327_05220, partial [Candidatus Paceibacterota bacterium]|nr:hypothetical protein [Candidatus Paceibacterota bacterium]
MRKFEPALGHVSVALRKQPIEVKFPGKSRRKIRPVAAFQNSHSPRTGHLSGTGGLPRHGGEKA